MGFPNAYAQYNNSRVLTASSAELTLMLYEGAIKFCNIAQIGIENQEVQKAHVNIIKTQKIIEHLQATLDANYPVAQDFSRIYDYLIKSLIQANVKKDVVILEEVNGHLHSIRDTWKEIMRLNKEKGSL